MSRKAFLFSLCLIALLPPVAAHKYFFGLTEVSLNPANNTVEVVHQYTLHDIQRAMTEQYGRNFRIEDSKADGRFQQWLKQHFQVRDSSGKPVKLDWVGYEADFQAIWFYQEAAVSANDFCSWQVTNSLLMDVYSAQVNTVNFVTPDSTRGVTLTAADNDQSVHCKE